MNMKTIATTAIAILVATSGLRADALSDGVDLIRQAPKPGTYSTDPANAAFWKANLPSVQAAVSALLAQPERKVSPQEGTLGGVWYYYGLKSANTPESIELLRRFNLQGQMLDIAVQTAAQYADLKADDWVVNGLPIAQAYLRFTHATKFRDWSEADRIFTETGTEPSFWANGNTALAYRTWFAQKIAGKSAQETYDIAIAQAASLEAVDSANAKSVVEFLNSVADSRYLMLQRQRALNSNGR